MASPSGDSRWHGLGFYVWFPPFGFIISAGVHLARKVGGLHSLKRVLAARSSARLRVKRVFSLAFMAVTRSVVRQRSAAHLSSDVRPRERERRIIRATSYM